MTAGIIAHLQRAYAQVSIGWKVEPDVFTEAILKPLRWWWKTSPRICLYLNVPVRQAALIRLPAR